MTLKTVYEYAREYTGASDLRKGGIILDFLREEGLQPDHRVLEMGCGCLAVGADLIRFLSCDRYVGVDPNGWLIRSALDEEPSLAAKCPRFLVRGDFIGFLNADYVIAHSVLSHVSLGEMERAFGNVRDYVREGVVWLASLRLGANDYDDEWRYPDAAFFSLETVSAVAGETGWQVEHVPEYRERLSATCADDIHDWVRLTAA